ncbi:MAG TPA: hypothetical protein VLH08_06585 [Acidobacteriota bacterium]|nr:hypothetical protein [Acidobacteriota bacterium]
MNSRIALFMAVVLLLIVSVWLGFSFYTAQTKKELSKKWDEEFNSFEDFEKRFPKHRENHAALELEKLAASVGIDLTPKDIKNRVRPDKKKKEAFKKIKDEMQKVLYSRLSHENSDVIVLSDGLKDFLQENESKLNEIVEVATREPKPLWAVDISKHVKAPIPNLLGQIQMQRFLNLKASLLIGESRFTEAENVLEASWNINNHLLSRPELLSYLIGIVVIKFQAGNLRQIPLSNNVWHTRINDPEIGMHLWVTQQGEVLMMLKAAEQGETLQQNDKRRSPYELIVSPYVHVMTLNFADRMYSYLCDLKKRDGCSPKKLLKDNEVKSLFPSWNIIGPVMFVDPAGPWNRVMLLNHDLELTSKIIEIKTGLDLNSHSFGTEYTLPSMVCPGEKWNYEKVSDGFKLTFSKRIDWSVVDLQENALILPDSYSSEIKSNPETQ